MDFSANPERRILAFGDSNTYGYDPATDGRYGKQTRWPCRLQTLLGPDAVVIEEGLPGRTAVFDDPITEGLCGLDFITPLMASHAPLDTVIIMLGTNDTKARFGCAAPLLALGIVRLVKKALTSVGWRAVPDVLVVCPTPIVPEYATRMFGDTMGDGCDERAAALAAALQPLLAELPNVRFVDAAHFPGVETHPLDGVHLTAEAHLALANALAEELRP